MSRMIDVYCSGLGDIVAFRMKLYSQEEKKVINEIYIKMREHCPNLGSNVIITKEDESCFKIKSFVGTLLQAKKELEKSAVDPEETVKRVLKVMPDFDMDKYVTDREQLKLKEAVALKKRRKIAEEKWNQLKTDKSGMLPKICLFSGVGGRNSALFSLGVLMVLDRHGIYDTVEYHAGASGGAIAMMIWYLYKKDRNMIMKMLLSEFTKEVDVINMIEKSSKHNYKEFAEFLGEEMPKKYRTMQFARLGKFAENFKFPIPLMVFNDIEGQHFEPIFVSPYEADFISRGKSVDPEYLGRRIKNGNPDKNGRGITVSEALAITGNALSLPAFVIEKNLPEYVKPPKEIEDFLKAFFGRYSNHCLMPPYKLRNPFITSDQNEECDLELTDGGASVSANVLKFLIEGCDVIIILSVDCLETRIHFVRVMQDLEKEFAKKLKCRLPEEFYKVIGDKDLENKSSWVFKGDTKKKTVTVVYVNPFTIPREVTNCKYEKEEIIRRIIEGIRAGKISVQQILEVLKLKNLAE